jgi:uncharacterized protein (TIGR02145 family)
MKMILYLLAAIIFITACDKNSEPDPPLTDIDGNEYDTVKISSQFWMQQNLNTSHYRNGDPIPEITNILSWSYLTSGAWCWYNNDSVTYGSIYGKLYNWYAVNDPRGLAPEGWHIPTDAEWTTLSSRLGGDSSAGGEMKETGTTHWTSPNTGATNNSGITCLPAGYRLMDGSFFNLGKSCFWWSSTGSGAADAYYRNLYYLDAQICRGDGSIGDGFSVRCIKD